MPLTPEQRTVRARMAAHARWSKEDGRRNAELGQNGLLERFAREVDPDGSLTPAERHRRAEHARKAHMLRLSLASATARAARRGSSA